MIKISSMFKRVFLICREFGKSRVFFECVLRIVVFKLLCASNMSIRFWFSLWQS